MHIACCIFCLFAYVCVGSDFLTLFSMGINFGQLDIVNMHISHLVQKIFRSEHALLCVNSLWLTAFYQNCAFEIITTRILTTNAIKGC